MPGLPVFDWGRVLEFVATQALEALQWIAQKALIGFCMFVLLPIALWNARIFAMNILLPFLIEKAGLPADSFFVELSGVAGWFATCLKLDICLGLLINAAFSKQILKLIRGII